MFKLYIFSQEKRKHHLKKISIFYSLLYQGQLLILFFPLIDHESIWTYSICSASECRYFLFNLVLRRVKGRWFIVLYSSGTRLSKWVRRSNVIDLHNFCDDTVLTAQKKMSIERLGFKPQTSRMNSTINNIYIEPQTKNWTSMSNSWKWFWRKRWETENFRPFTTKAGFFLRLKKKLLLLSSKTGFKTTTVRPEVYILPPALTQLLEKSLSVALSVRMTQWHIMFCNFSVKVQFVRFWFFFTMNTLWPKPTFRIIIFCLSDQNVQQFFLLLSFFSFLLSPRLVVFFFGRFKN